MLHYIPNALLFYQCLKDTTYQAYLSLCTIKELYLPVYL